MGEILGPAMILLIVIVAIVAAVAYFNASNRRRSTLSKAPAVLLPPGEHPDVLMQNSVNSYNLLKRAVRLLDHALSEKILDDASAKEAQKIVNEFFKDN